MKIEFDFDTKIITVNNTVNLEMLISQLENMNIIFSEWTLNTTIINEHVITPFQYHIIPFDDKLDWKLGEIYCSSC